jgi:ribosomal protein S18 acetylase RimI-like enzyme
MLVVEPARDEDLQRVATLAQRTLLETYDSEWLHHHAHRRGAFLVARDIPTNRVVGFALADQEACEAHLLALAVEEGHQGQGIGTALLRHVRDHLAQQGAYKLSLHVRADDSRAQVFYVRHGFAPEGLQTQAYRDGEDAVRMGRPL